MIKKGIFLFCLFAIVLSCNSEPVPKPEEENTEPELEIFKKDRPPIKGMCIFVGQVEVFSDTDWQLLADSPVTDFIVIPKETSEYGNSEEGYKNKLAPFMVKVINELVSRNDTARVWIGTPGITSLNFELASSSLLPFFHYMEEVRRGVGDYIWDNNIGVYMNEEAVYGPINETNPLENPCIKLMVDMAQKVHNELNSEFLWIPYYGYGKYSEDIIKGLAQITNLSTVYDYVVIQPHYYFDQTIPDNLKGVRHSIVNQAISAVDGSVVIPKNSKTLVGPEIEFNWKMAYGDKYPQAKAVYNEYLAAFSEFVGVYPVIFYWDGPLKSALNNCIIPLFEGE